MANDKIEVIDGSVQPRLYQVYGDLIESKEVMEPLAIVAGTGPICGFDWVDTSKPNVVIKSIFNNPSTELSTSILKRYSKKIMLSTPENLSGQVFNAYNTPDGLINIAPDVLDFMGIEPDGGWPDLTNPGKLVAFSVKVSHTYKQDPNDKPSNIDDFTVQWLNLDDIKLEDLLDGGYQQVVSLISSRGFVNFDTNTEALIGIYLIGWPTTWAQESSPNYKYQSVVKSLGYNINLIPTDGTLPSKLSYIIHGLYLSNKVENGIPDRSIEGVKLKLATVSADEIGLLAVENKHLASNSVDSRTIMSRSINSSHISTNSLGPSVMSFGIGGMYSSTTIYVDNLSPTEPQLLGSGVCYTIFGYNIGSVLAVAKFKVPDRGSQLQVAHMMFGIQSLTSQVRFELYDKSNKIFEVTSTSEIVWYRLFFVNNYGGSGQWYLIKMGNNLLKE